jgi:hypothetical protein
MPSLIPIPFFVTKKATKNEPCAIIKRQCVLIVVALLEPHSLYVKAGKYLKKIDMLCAFT